MPPRKHSIQAEGEPPSPKIARTDSGPENGFASGGGKKRNAASQRTGQACDRCKARKIRCDDTEGGCLPCRQNNTECKTTDRITHRATVRGHTEALERETSLLRQQVYELEEQLRELGIEPRPATQYASSRASLGAWPSASAGIPQLYAHNQSNIHTNGFENGAHAAQEANMFALPTWREGQPTGDPHLGVSPNNDLLSPVKGTSLSVFGFQVDVADYVDDRIDDDDSPTSYKSLLQSTFKTHSRPASLPATYEECAQYAHYFLVSINPWAPTLHKHTFNDLIKKIYHDNYQPTVAESVMVHVMLANIKYQFAKRNASEANIQSSILEESFQHHHFALSKMYELRTSRTIDDIRAITMIVVHLRNFPKPAPAYLFTSWAFTMCIEMGLHRSESAWMDDSPKKDRLEVEMRKRVFWLLLTMHVFLSGKMGRPMPIRLEDIDIEYPEMLNEDLEPASAGTGEKQCHYGGTVQVFKLTPLFLETYNSVYALKPTANYEDIVRRLELKIEKWRRELPPELADVRHDSSAAEKGTEIFALYLQSWESELQLLLHHPHICKSQSPEVWNRNLTYCWDAAKRIIDVNRQLALKLSLDSTWYQATVFIASIFTLLFISWERRTQMTVESFNVLRADMDISCELLGKLGILLGSGPRLREAMSQIIEPSLSRLQRFQLEQTASAGIKQSPGRSPNHRQPQALKPDPSLQQSTSNAMSSYQPASEAATDPAGSHLQQDPSRASQQQQHRHHQDPPSNPFHQSHPATASSGPAPMQTQQQTQNPYPAPIMAPTAAYPGPQHSASSQAGDSSSGLAMGYPYNPYQSGGPPGYGANHIGQQPGLQNGDAFSPVYGHQSGAGDSNGYGGPHQWRQWVGVAKEHMQPHEYMSSAQTLMALQGGRGELATGQPGEHVQSPPSHTESAQQQQAQREQQQQAQVAASNHYGITTATVGNMQWPMTAYNIRQQFGGH